MKTVKYFLFFFILSATFFSCQKELDFETGSGQSTGSLVKDASSNCTSITLNGIYKVDSVLTATHYLDVSVNVTAVGAYVIKTDSVSGFYFNASGSFNAAGIQTVRLQGFGKPISAGPKNFTIRYNNISSCSVSITVFPASGVPMAVFSLDGAPGACTTPDIQGTYTALVPLNATNKLVANVNVVSTGIYTLSTGIVNGVTFVASGTFSTTGNQPVTLSATGIPQTPGTNMMSISGAGPSGCSFPLTVTTAGGGGGGTSNFVYAGSFGDCRAGSSFLGKYIAGTAFTAGEFMNAEVFVATAGTYTIYTDTVNGVYFRKTGMFTTTGAQTISVPGFGTPTTTGDFTFEMFKNSGVAGSCTSYNCFFGNGAGASAGDYFPLTANSWWSYNSGSVPPPDSLYKKAETLSVIGANTYRKFYIGLQPVVAPYDSTHFRKPAQDLIQYLRVDSFIGQPLVVTQYSEVVMLKQNVPAGTTWQSSTFVGIDQLGQPWKIVYRFQLQTVGGTMTIAGKTYTDVIKVAWGCFRNVNNFGGYEQGFAVESYYARGVGLIKQKTYPGWPNTSWDTDDLRNHVVF